MDRDTGRTRPWYFWPLITFVAGLLLGWLVIGWWLWPVEWRNALPQDLAPRLQNQYLTMVAESYAANGNVQLARDRLAGWPADELAVALGNTQENLAATDAARAANVQLLASALSLSTGGVGVSGAGPLPTAQSAQPTPVPGGDDAAGLSLLRICTAFLWIVLVLAAIAFFIYLFMRWRAAQQGTEPPDVGALARQILGRKPAPVERAEYEYRSGGERGEGFESSLAEETAAEVAAQEKSRWSDPTDADWREVGSDSATPPRVSYDDRLGTDFEEETVEDADLPPFRSPREEPRMVPPRPAAEPTFEVSRPVSPVRRSGIGAKLGDFVAVYQMGEPDYDEAFDINDPVDGLVGQCGLQLNEPVGRNRDQAVALQVWLWDSSDPDTRVKVLMSEAAYRDTATRAQHVSEHEAVPVRQGTDFELESHDLLLRGQIERVEYAEQEANRAVFADLQVHMQVFRKS
jgi:hypothetical protein